MDHWRMQQEEELEKFFDCYNRYTCLDDEIPPLSSWLIWCKDYICRSFSKLEQERPWIAELAMKDDHSPFMTRHGGRAYSFLRLLRSYARGAYQKPNHGLTPEDYQKPQLGVKKKYEEE